MGCCRGASTGTAKTYTTNNPTVVVDREGVVIESKEGDKFEVVNPLKDSKTGR